MYRIYFVSGEQYNLGSFSIFDGVSKEDIENDSEYKVMQMRDKSGYTVTDPSKLDPYLKLTQLYSTIALKKELGEEIKFYTIPIYEANIRNNHEKDGYFEINTLNEEYVRRYMTAEGYNFSDYAITIKCPCSFGKPKIKMVDHKDIIIAVTENTNPA